jgi:mono/diheme cytochrome c family protein
MQDVALVGMGAALLVGAVACSGATTTPTSGVGAPTTPEPAPPASAAPADGPMSDPLEYAIERPTWEVGHAIFARTGLGDPYRVGVPYPLYLAMVRRNPDLFGGDLQAMADRFGFVARAADPASGDRDVREGLPVGLHLTDDPFTGVPFVVHNCALCHAERVRWPGGEQVVIGLGNKRVRIHDYDAAFAAVTRAPEFELGHLLDAAEQEAARRDVRWPYDWRLPMTKATIDALELRARARADFLGRVGGGPPGRVAVIESFALVMAARLGREIDTGAEVGWAKVPDVVGFGVRNTLSWDGAGEGPMDILVVEADFAAGVRPAWFTSHPLQGASLSAYLRRPERELRFPGRVDRKLAARGRVLFDDACAPCHGTYGDDGRVRDYEEQVVALADLGTDPTRAAAVTDAFVAAAHEPALTPGLPPGLLRTRRTGGYVPPVLTSVWARAPYGHAGQWASLAMLAMAPDKRPARYTIDLDAPIDLATVGLPVHAATPARKPPAGGYLHDGTRPGLSVLGHPFLSDLGAADAKAVIEYLKTL